VSAAPSASHPGRLHETLLPGDLVLSPLSRRPTVLEDSTLRTILDRPVPAFEASTTKRPDVSVVVATRDNLPFLRLSLETVLAHSGRPCELIVVDNGSTDGTAAYLEQLVERNPGVRVITNEENRGFASASNQGAAIAAAEVLVLLNDDTVVCDDWLEPLLVHLASPGVGMVGPCTNRTGNEAEIDAEYRTWEELSRFAEARSRDHAGEAFEMETLTMFCVAMPRSIYEQVGPLDERFETGLLEDDDYSRRVRGAGYRLLCADDAFVHHFGETSFGKLAASGEYARLLEANRARYEEKWQESWKPYGRRQSDRYLGLLERVRRQVEAAIPRDATVLVVSRGDEELLRLDGRKAWHFPRSEDGGYAGHHPADNDEAIARLEQQRSEGAEYIVFPATAAWWLDHYAGFRGYLDGHYERKLSDPETCFVYDLRERRL
jgi:GT2 family glycosyltransferase